MHAWCGAIRQVLMAKARITALPQHRLLLDTPTLGADLVYLSSNWSLDLEHRLVCLSSSLTTPTLAALSSVLSSSLFLLLEHAYSWRMSSLLFIVLVTSLGASSSFAFIKFGHAYSCSIV